MVYAPDHRPYYDADSHIMELPDFLRSYADPDIRDEIPLVDYTASVVTDEEIAVIVDQGSRHSDDHREAQIALDDPASAIAELDWIIDNGLESVWVPHRAPIDIAPGHVDLEPFWARLAEAGVPFVIHVGGAPLHTAKEWSNNGRGKTRDWLGGGENVRTKDAMLMHHYAETFVSMLVADGVFARHPGLRGAAVELGAGWVPEMLRRLDSVARIFGRVDENMQFDRKPSEQLTEQMGFTPFPHEDVARLIADSNEDLYLFSSDYPHIEGGRDPIGKFEGHMAPTSDEAKTKFFSENFLRLWPEARVAA